MSLSNRESFKDEQSMCYHYHFHCHCFCYCYCYLRSEDTGSLWMSTASTILTSTLPLPMNLPPLRSGFQNCDYEEKVDVIKFQVFLPRFGHSMVSGLFEPIGHKKWPLKFHFHDFQEFVLGDDGRAYQNELRVRFASHTPHICLFCDHNNVYHYNFLCCWIIMTGKWRLYRLSLSLSLSLSTS